MNEIEKIKRYISNTGIPKDVISRYDLRYSELDALKPSFDTIVLAYEYGMAKGYIAAKAEIIGRKGDSIQAICSILKGHDEFFKNKVLTHARILERVLAERE